MTVDLNRLAQRHEALKNKRREWESDWKLIAQIFTSREIPLERQNGQDGGGVRRLSLDSTAFYALRDLASGLHGGMTSPARPWFALELVHREANQSVEAKQWLAEVEDAMRTVFQRSNFYNAVHMVYRDLGGFGTSFVFAVEDEDTVVSFMPVPIGTYCLDTNHRGQVDTVFRTISMTLRQMVSQFGEEKLPENLRNSYQDMGNWGNKFNIIHAIFPKEKKDEGRAFQSVYWLEGMQGGAGFRGSSLLSEGGFDEFPGMGVRWAVQGNNVYGDSPAMDSLGDGIMIQQMTRSVLKAIQMEIDPPMAVPANLKGESFLPGSIIPIAQMGQGQGPVVYPAVQVQHNIAATDAAIRDRKEQIKEGLFNDLFKMLISSDRRNITATEVAAREEEKLALIGPVLERLHNEFFNPLISRVFNIMVDYGLVPEPPEEIEGQGIQVRFVSILAQAQKMVATGSVEQLVTFVGRLSEADPAVLDSLDMDKAVETYGDSLGRSDLLRSKEEREALRQRRAESEEKARMEQEMMASIEAAKGLGQASLDGTALGALKELGD